MKLLSDIISKKVLNLFSGKIEGTITNLCFDNRYKKVSSLKMINEDDDELTIHASKVYHIGSSAVVIKNTSALQLDINQITKEIENNPINYEVYSIFGDFLGSVTDVELDDELKIINLVTPTNKINPEQILNVNKNIIVNLSDNKVKISSFRPRIKLLSSSLNEKVSILAPQISTTNTDKINQNAKFKISTTPSPQKIIGNSDFLIGRKMLKTVYGLNNEIIIKKDNIINEAHIKSAKKHNKLMELTICSRKK